MRDGENCAVGGVGVSLSSYIKSSGGMGYSSGKGVSSVVDAS